MWRNFHVRTGINKIEVMYDRPRVINVKVERGSTFAFTRDLPYIASISFTRVKFTYVSTLKLRSYSGKVKKSRAPTLYETL